VDNILSFAWTAAALLYYLLCILETLQHHRVTVKLRKTHSLPSRAEFVEIDILKEGNSPAKSKIRSGGRTRTTGTIHRLAHADWLHRLLLQLDTTIRRMNRKMTRAHETSPRPRREDRQGNRS
jgi:hypothetical protein